LGRAPLGARAGTGYAWYLWAPLLAEGKLAGALGVASKRGDFDLVRAFRGLYVLAVHLGVYLSWALARDQVLARSAGRATAAEQADLRFECLGSFRLAGRGGPVSPDVFGRLKALTLLKFLVSQRGRPVPREALIEVLWPEADPVRAAANLRVVLHALRRGLTVAASRDGSQLLVSAGDMVYLDPSRRMWVDAEEFVALARLAGVLEGEGKVDEALDAMRRAARLYKGDYLEDEPYSDWCLLERERLKETYLNLLRQTARIEAQRGELPRAVETCRAALRVDPLREDVHRRLIRLLIDLGHVADAVHQYNVCRRELRNGLGAEPSSETRAAYAAALATMERR
ncbi:MAG: winged helix-turn-helix domain-containing protein, partial [Chloroflexi bacterium]|nr:winged helix-turn-helix domain-containing protein [Chloroflexota bacterium]